MSPDEIERKVFGYEIDWSNTEEVKFENLSPERARQLLEAGHIDPERRCNGSPKMGEIIDFMQTYSRGGYDVDTDEKEKNQREMYAHGRVFPPESKIPIQTENTETSSDTTRDSRILIEGVKYSGETSDEFVLEFARLFNDADSFMLEKDLHAMCWYSEKGKTGKR